MALWVAARAGKSDMEMVIVPPPRPNLCHPGPLPPALVAQRALDRRVDKNALHQGLSGDCLQQTTMLRCPGRWVNVPPTPRDNIFCRDAVPLGRAKPSIWHWRQPNIGIEPDLVRSVARQHRSAARLRDVTDEKPGPAGLAGQFLRQPFEKGYQYRVTPGSIA